VSHPSFLLELTILVLAIFLGFEVISKVPTMLHTPLMSGTNAIRLTPRSWAASGRTISSNKSALAPGRSASIRPRCGDGT